MLQKIQLENFCQHENLQWTSLQNINLIIGENSSGKTILLKALYAALRTLEQYGKGNDKRELADILAEKLYWTFQVEALGDLVEKGKSALNFSMVEDSAEFCFTFGKDTNMKIGKIQNTFDTPRQNKSVFIPAKEVLSLFNIILKSRDQDSTIRILIWLRHCKLLHSGGGILMLLLMDGKNWNRSSRGR